jgi:hypothetical protein
MVWGCTVVAVLADTVDTTALGRKNMMAVEIVAVRVGWSLVNHFPSYRLNCRYPRFCSRFQSSHFLSYRFRLQNFHLLSYRLHRYSSRPPRASVAEVVAGTLQTRR